ncbi:MAG: type II toxin-antitoxin system RelE/ParE family toxin [Thermovirgaceae bacterium]|nr:type II toxin-antitoxin system RelE/ParE family toxin [Thermovirgaceae bacterium]
MKHQRMCQPVHILQNQAFPDLLDPFPLRMILTLIATELFSQAQEQRFRLVIINPYYVPVIKRMPVKISSFCFIALHDPPFTQQRKGAASLAGSAPFFCCFVPSKGVPLFDFDDLHQIVEKYIIIDIITRTGGRTCKQKIALLRTDGPCFSQKKPSWKSSTPFLSTYRPVVKHLIEMIQDLGLTAIGLPFVKHVEKDLWELRAKGKSGITRGLYVTRSGRCIYILRVIHKKTARLRRNDIETAMKRAGRIGK